MCPIEVGSLAEMLALGTTAGALVKALAAIPGGIQVKVGPCIVPYAGSGTLAHAHMVRGATFGMSAGHVQRQGS